MVVATCSESVACRFLFKIVSSSIIEYKILVLPWILWHRRRSPEMVELLITTHVRKLKASLSVLLTGGWLGELDVSIVQDNEVDAATEVPR